MPILHQHAQRGAPFTPASCYFLLNYALISEFVKSFVKPKEDLLFSFELCLNAKPDLVEVSIDYFGLLFSFELCSRRALALDAKARYAPCYFLLNYAHGGATLRRAPWSSRTCYFLLNYAAKKKSALRRLEQQPCYFLLNYAEDVGYHVETEDITRCRYNRCLAIFF